MNIKNINKFFLIFILFFLISCKSFEKNIKNSNKNINNQELKITENNSELINTNSNTIDPISSNNFNWKLNIKLKSLHKLKNFSHEDNSNYLKSYLIDDIVYSISNKNTFNSFNLITKKQINRLDIFDDYINQYSYPTSFIFLNGFFYLAFSNATIIKFDYDGNIDWSISFNDILKTPLKIQSQNIIVMLSDRILSIDHLNGNINWDFQYSNDNLVLSDGGFLINVNNLIYFILPNKNIGNIDTLIGKKINSFVANIKIDNNLWKLSNSLYNFKNSIYLIENNSLISSINTNNQNYNYKKINLFSIKSHFFINDLLIVINDKNFLQSYTLENMNLYWEIDIKKLIKKYDKIINIIMKNDNLIIFMESGLILEIDKKSGNINNYQKINVKDINGVYFHKDYIFVNSRKGNVNIFKQ